MKTHGLGLAVYLDQGLGPSGGLLSLTVWYRGFMLTGAALRSVVPLHGFCRCGSHFGNFLRGPIFGSSAVDSMGAESMGTQGDRSAMESVEAPQATEGTA